MSEEPSKTAPDNVVSAIAAFNMGRDLRVLARKYQVMAASRFAFFRATAHLFYAHALRMKLPASPAGWICGDLHIENFGVYKSDNRLAYFDVNDFDEACFGPLSADLVRFGASILISCAEFGLDANESNELALNAFAAYLRILQNEKPIWSEEELASGAIEALFEQVAKRKRSAFLNERTSVRKQMRHFITDGRRYFQHEPYDEKRLGITKALANLPARNDGFFELRDIAFRVAGLGSLGLRRYGILVKGRDDPDKNALFDMKGAAPSSAAVLMPERQPKWATQAQRIVTLQKRLQAMPACQLTALRIGRRDYILRELQPTEDRLNLAALAKHRARALGTLNEAFSHMGEMAASLHLRGAARQGADGPDILIRFAAKARPDEWLAASAQMKLHNDVDFEAFNAALAADDPLLAATLKE